jgi:hypothetical protein
MLSRALVSAARKSVAASAVAAVEAAPSATALASAGRAISSASSVCAPAAAMKPKMLKDGSYAFAVTPLSKRVMSEDARAVYDM